MINTGTDQRTAESKKTLVSKYDFGMTGYREDIVEATCSIMTATVAIALKLFAHNNLSGFMSAKVN
jgi:hypothetical protein